MCQTDTGILTAFLFLIWRNDNDEIYGKMTIKITQAIRPQKKKKKLIEHSK